MSTFKRYQSKVFWKQMAVQDKAASSMSPDWEPQVLQQEISSNSCEDDDHRNITAIFVDGRQDIEKSEEKEEKISRADNSCSPVSQDIRSQDSGFSDSSDPEAEAYENETPRRRRRRRCRVPERAIPKPSHTSTPKDPRTLFFHKKNTTSTSSPSSPLQESRRAGSECIECLGDFLYATEPPEDPEEEPRSLRSESSSSNSIQLDFRGKTSATRAWLCELVERTESECCITLQSKSLPSRRKSDAEREAAAATGDTCNLSSIATAAASKLLLKADEFEQRYKRIVWKISTETRQEEACRSQKDLLRSIEEDAFSLLKELGAPPPRRIQLGSHKTIMKQLQSLKNNVDDVIETRLDFYVERIVRALEDASTEDSSTVRGSLAALTALGLAGTRAADSIARCSGIRALLTSLMSANRLSSEFRAAALRALASVCCSALAIERFVKDGGAEILSDLLATRSSPEKERMEATSLVVQITAPWTNAQGLPYLESFADSLVPSITDLGESTECGQTLLLTAAALNQISKSRRFASAILENDTVRRLLRSVKKTSGSNVWVMEQVASLVGELAKFPEARPHLARAKASVALVCFLRMRPPGVEDAYKRLEATAAAALTRMCVDPEIAKQVVAVGGADCLPTYYDTGSELAEQTDAAGLLKYTKSLRRACKKASKHIDSAKASDYSPLS